MDHLIMRLEAPLMSFGAEIVDNIGPTRWFPATSMLTGLLANALGYRRQQHLLHQTLEERIIFAARIDREPTWGATVQDYQTASIERDDRSWTTRGEPEGRTGDKSTYEDGTHNRLRHYLPDMSLTLALRLEPDRETPTIDDLAEALQRPKRPLFIGRKSCIPSEPIFQGITNAGTAMAALLATPIFTDLPGTENIPNMVRFLWPDGEGAPGVEPQNSYTLTDQRNWTTRLHGGGRTVNETTVPMSPSLS